MGCCGFGFFALPLATLPLPVMLGLGDAYSCRHLWRSLFLMAQRGLIALSSAIAPSSDYYAGHFSPLGCGLLVVFWGWLCWGAPSLPFPCGLPVIRFLFCAPFGTTRIRGPGGSSPLSPEGGMRRCCGLGLWFLLVLGWLGGLGGWVVLSFVALATLCALGASGTRPKHGQTGAPLLAS